MPNKEPELVVTVKDKVRVLRLNRPHKKNAINANLYTGIVQSLEEAAADPNTLIVVMTGTGDYFTSGNDLSALLEGVRGSTSAETSGTNDNTNHHSMQEMQEKVSSGAEMFRK
ncbi:Enoyl-CoA delta isomerase 2-like 1 [Homarus americanus]|uniref:Enoyl-CoA delta isomerase 2-like 1 n=1 Tax=Homarus americanus TaxID=6706 RepID=A0A8J5K214_HOMAM|nr:Enoyl-CoA delta isomerase 2-like 1 [Homarus americanus]